MFQGDYGVATPRNKNVIMYGTGRPKGMGRRNPHSRLHTRKLKGRHVQYDKTAIAISDGLMKINIFIDSRNTN